MPIEADRIGGCGRPRSAPTRRGSVYIAVLGSSLLVTSIGLGALAVARVRGLAATGDLERIQAREAARGVQELALWRLAGSERDDLPEADGRWLEDLRIGAAVAYVDLVDPVDGSPATGEADALQVAVITSLGDAVQRNTATVRIENHAESLVPRDFAGMDIRLDDDSSVAGRGVMRAAASVQAGSAPVLLDVQAEQGIRGTDLRGLVLGDGPSANVPDAGTVADMWADSAGVINVDDLPSEPPPMPPLLYAESFEAHKYTRPPNWNGSGCVMSPVAIADAVDGNRAVKLQWGDPTAQWWIQHWINANQVVPHVVAAVRVDPPGGTAEFQMRINWSTWSSGHSGTDESAVVRAEGGWVELAVSCTSPSHEMNGDLTIFTVDGSKASFVLDHVRVYDSAAVGGGGDAPRLLERVHLSPTTNPFGAASADGVYLIDLGGEDLVIRECMIEGTLILKNPGSGTRIEGSVAWRPVVPGDPILIVTGSTTPEITIATDEIPLVESTLSVDLDGDGERLSVFASRLEGLVLVGGNVVLGGRPRFAGSLIARGSVSFEGAHAVFERGAVDPRRVPTGFPVDRRTVAVVPGSATTLVP